MSLIKEVEEASRLPEHVQSADRSPNLSPEVMRLIHLSKQPTPDVPVDPGNKWLGLQPCKTLAVPTIARHTNVGRGRHGGRPQDPRLHVTSCMIKTTATRQMGLPTTMPIQVHQAPSDSEGSDEPATGMVDFDYLQINFFLRLMVPSIFVPINGSRGQH